MKVYIMTDLEGVAGVMNSTDWIYPESRYYERGKELLTKEVNAAIDGFFAAGRPAPGPGGSGCTAGTGGPHPEPDRWAAV